MTSTAARRTRALLAASQGRSGRRVQWGLVDQAISSLTNFFITLLVARQSGARAFGTFSLGLTLYVFLLWVSRSLVTDPFVVRVSGAAAHVQRRSAAHATGAALTVGLLAAPLVAIVGFLAERGAPLIIGAFALAIPFLLTQDALRYVLFAAGRARAAAINDLVWLLVQVVSIAASFLVQDSPRASTLVGSFGVGAAVAALYGCRQTGVVPSPRSAWLWIYGHRDLGIPFVTELIAVTGTVQIALLAVGTVAGIVALGELRAAMLLMGPLTVLFLGVFVVTTPEAVRLVKRSPEALSRLVIGLGTVMLTTTVVWALAIQLVPDEIGARILGANWGSGRRLLLPVAALIAGNSCALAAVVGLRALGAARASLGARLWGAPVVLIGGIVGARIGGPYGAAVGLAMASWVDVVLAGTAFRRALSQYDGSSNPADVTPPLTA